MSETAGGPTWNAVGPPGSTPLDPDDAEGLIPSWVATRADLNEAEQRNIVTGLDRRRWRRPSVDVMLDDLTVRDLHKDMFGAVWRWAGTYRRREASIGIDPMRVSTSVRDLMEDARLWVGGERPMPPDEARPRPTPALRADLTATSEVLVPPTMPERSDRSSRPRLRGYGGDPGG